LSIKSLDKLNLLLTRLARFCYNRTRPGVRDALDNTTE
jgi:hypothetical protein